jgi:hypothetical protein
MMGLLQLNPPIPLVTPKGKAHAHIFIDYGIEHYGVFVCFLDDGTGDCYLVNNKHAKIQGNWTFDRKSPKAPIDEVKEHLS